MENSTVLRNIIIGKYMPKFDYLKGEFAFRTVFYRGAFSYCMCDCGIHHEYLDYIDESGEIIEDIFKDVVACIDKGQCPHVDGVNSDFVTESRLSALHILAASGTSGCIEKRRKFQEYTLGGYLHTFKVVRKYSRPTIGRLDQCRSMKRNGGTLLSLTPLDIIVLKNRKHVPVFGRTFNVNLPILIIERIISDNKKQCVKFDAAQYPHICMQYKNYYLLEYLYMQSNSIDFVLQTAFLLNDLNVIESFTNNPMRFGKRPGESTMRECCKLAILYDKPEYLRHFLENFPDRSENKSDLFDMCKTLNREECKRVILDVAGPVNKTSQNANDLTNSPESASTARIHAMLSAMRSGLGLNRIHVQPGPSDTRSPDSAVLSYLSTELLSNRMCLRSIVEVISPYFKSLADGSEEKRIICLWSDIINTDLTNQPLAMAILRGLGDSYFFRRLKNATSLEAWLRSLVGVNNVHGDGMTPLLELLAHCKELGPKLDIFKFRRCLEMYFNQNPDVTLNRTALELALEIDQMIYDKEPIQDKWVGTYIVDGRPHGLFGHDVQLALNMTVPLLIESGFPVPDSLLDTIVAKKDAIPTEEYEYILATRGHIRSLDVVVRDFMRSHYKGRQIHTFVDTAYLPQILKDFILLKPLLRMIPEKNSS